MPKDSPHGGSGFLFGPLRADGDVRFRRELWAWAMLAVASLAIAGVFALLLALSRFPGIEQVLPWPLDFFHKGLVIHVVFSFVVWFLAVFGALAAIACHDLAGARPRMAALGMISLAAMAAAAPLLFLPAFFDRSEATLNNYVPVIIDPLYYAGLAIMAVAMALAALRLVGNLLRYRRTATPFSFGVGAAAVIYLIAFICFAAACLLLGQEPLSYAFNEDLFWGGGHVLQFLNTLLLLVAWGLLAEAAGIGPLVSSALWKVAVAVLVAFALVAPVLYLLYEPFSADQTVAFTNLQYGLAPSTLLVAGVALATVKEWRPGRHPALLCLMLSALVFFAGGLLGLFVDGGDTRTPGHYHGVIAGVTLAFMGLFYVMFLPLTDRAITLGRAVRVQIWLFALGQLAASIGLFVAGGHGTPRKVAGEAQGLEDLGAIIGMAVNGVGGLIAVIGGIMFIWLAAVALLRRDRSKKPQTGTVLPL